MLHKHIRVKTVHFLMKYSDFFGIIFSNFYNSYLSAIGCTKHAMVL